MVNGGPAFPATTVNDTNGNLSDPFGTLLPPSSQATYSGMTLRDYFAAKAIPLMFSYDEVGDKASYDRRQQMSLAAGLAYEMADAMLKARQA